MDNTEEYFLQEPPAGGFPFSKTESTLPNRRYVVEKVFTATKPKNKKNKEEKNMKNVKRILTLLVVLAMVFTCVIALATAEAKPRTSAAPTR